MTTHPIMRMCHGLLVLLLCTPACSISFHRVNHWDEAFWFGDEPVTMTKSLHVDAPADASRVSITITVGCTAGTLAWSLVDPVGVERDRQVVRLGSHESQANWPVLPGDWHLHVSTIGFCGGWSVTLGACSEPMKVKVEVANAAGKRRLTRFEASSRVVQTGNGATDSPGP